jgi:hypothetical protein
VGPTVTTQTEGWHADDHHQVYRANPSPSLAKLQFPVEPPGSAGDRGRFQSVGTALPRRHPSCTPTWLHLTTSQGHSEAFTDRQKTENLSAGCLGHPGRGLCSPQGPSEQSQVHIYSLFQLKPMGEGETWLEKHENLWLLGRPRCPGDSGMRQATSEPCSAWGSCCHARLPASE